MFVINKDFFPFFVCSRTVAICFDLYYLFHKYTSYFQYNHKKKLLQTFFQFWLISELNDAFFKSYSYAELINGSKNYSSGWVRIHKKAGVVIADISLYFKNALSIASHQLLGAGTLEDIGCSPGEISAQSGAISSHQHCAIYLTADGFNGLTIYPAETVTVGDDFRTQLVWFAD